MRKCKKIAIAVIAATLTLTMGITSFAGQWQHNDIGWWWQEDDGSWPASEWKWIDGNNDGLAECYYFNENGYMLADTTTPDGYLVDGNGAWIEDVGGYPKLIGIPEGGRALKMPEPILEMSTEFRQRKDNSEYFNQYSDLKEGKAFVYENLSGLYVAFVSLDFLNANYDGSYFRYYNVIHEDENYIEWNLLDGNGNLIGKYCEKDSTVDSFPEGNGYVRIFCYY